MTENNFSSAFLELATDSRLETLRKKGEVLFDGKLCNERDGGFNRLTQLPSDSVLKRLNDLEFDILSVNVTNRNWLVNRNSGWKEIPCYFSASQGVLFVYFKPDNRGYALKLSQAKQLKFAMYKNGSIKLKWKFGSLRVYLNKNQISKWQSLFVNAFNEVDMHRSQAETAKPASLCPLSPTQSYKSDTASIYSIKTANNAQIPCQVFDSVDLLLGKSSPRKFEMPPAMIVDSVELLNSTSACTSSDFLDTTLTGEDSTGTTNSAQIPCSVVDSVDLLLQVPVPKTIQLKPAEIVDSEELLMLRCSSMEIDHPEAMPVSPSKPRTVAEKIAYYRQLSRRPENDKQVKHSITMRRPC